MGINIATKQINSGRKSHDPVEAEYVKVERALGTVLVKLDYLLSLMKDGGGPCDTKHLKRQLSQAHTKLNNLTNYMKTGKDNG